MLGKFNSRGDLLPTCDADFFRVLYTAPVASTRTDPPGKRLKDGHGPDKAYFAFSDDLTFNLFDIEVGVPGIDNGEAIDITTQWNDEWRQFAPRYLDTLTEFTVVGAYDPIFFDEIHDLRGNEGTGTTHFPDGSTLAYYCYCRMLEFDSLVEGTMPRCTLTVRPTNTDPVTGGEESPVLVEVSGT